MKFLLVMPRFQPFGFDYDFPLGIAYISAALKASGVNVRCLNLNHDPRLVDEPVAEAVAEFDPDVCGCGGLSPHYPVVREVFEAARKAKPEIVNIVGGGVFTGAPDIMTELLDIDAGVVGEGENTVVEFAAALGEGRSLDEVRGLVFKGPEGRFVTTPKRAVFKELDSLTWPDLAGFGIEKAFENQLPNDSRLYDATDLPRALPMISSRSCPFSCTFCFHPNGRVYRERGLDDFFDELDHRIAEQGVNLVNVLDELFALKRPRLIEFCARMKERPVQWMAQLHVSTVDDETLGLMKDSGCVAIGYGLESMSPEILRSMKKQADPEQVTRALEMTQAHGIGIIGTFLFGDPADNPNNINETLAWWARHLEYRIDLQNLKVFPGAPVWHQAVERGLFESREASVETPGVNLTDIDEEKRQLLFWWTNLLRHAIVTPGHLRGVTAEGEHPQRGPLARFNWDCPTCNHHNEHPRLPIHDPYTAVMIRISCRHCRGVFDLPNPAQRERPSPELDRQAEQAATLLAQARERGNPLLLDQAIKAHQEIVDRHEAPHYFIYPALRHVAYHLALALDEEGRDRCSRLLAWGRVLYFNPWNPEHHARMARVLLEDGIAGGAALFLRSAQKLSEGDFALPDEKFEDLLASLGGDQLPLFSPVRLPN